MSKEHEQFIAAMVAKGKTREQAQAFLDILGSAMKRRGWIEGEPMDQEQIGDKLNTFMGGAE